MALLCAALFAAALHCSVQVKELVKHYPPLLLENTFSPRPEETSMMKAVMARSSSQDFSSKRHFHWTKKVGTEEEEEDDGNTLKPLSSSIPIPSKEDKNKNSNSSFSKDPVPSATASSSSSSPSQLQRRKLQAIAVTTRLRSVLTAFSKNRSQLPLGLGPRVVGTLFGHRKGHVHFAIQKDPTSQPAFLIELATPISGLVREMTSGLVRIALECDKVQDKKPKSAAPVRLLEEPVWRTYCNGRKSGFATKRECGPRDWKVLKAVEPISMGAGVLPPGADEPAEKGEDGEVMYMRAKFERIVGSRDCEAFYMMNPDSNGAPELSIYLLRV